MPLSFAYQLHAQGQTQDMTQSRTLFVGNVSFLLLNSRLYPISVYIAYIRILSKFYPSISFPFSFSVRVLTTSSPFPSPSTQQLPFHTQWQDLKDLFRQAGTILRAGVALGPDNRSRGFGKVVFATDADAERAVRMFNGRVVAYCGVWVWVELGIWLGPGVGCWIKIGTPTINVCLSTRHAPFIVGAFGAFCTLIFAS